MSDEKKEESKALTKEEKPAPQEEAGKEEPKQVKVPAKFSQLVKQLEEMTVLELAELVKVLEDKFGVSAMAPVVVAAAPVGGAGGAGAPSEEKSTFDVELAEAGGNKIAAIKAVRAVTQLGLKDAKDLVEGAPKMIKEGVAKEEAEKIKKTLEEAGVKVTLK